MACGMKCARVASHPELSVASQAEGEDQIEQLFSTTRKYAAL
jgi:hypothetical protein